MRIGVACGMCALLGASCKATREKAPAAEAATPVRSDAAAGARIDADPWSVLGDRPRAEPDAVFELSPDRSRPLVSTVGPVVVDGLVLVGSSQLGFVAIDLERRSAKWRRAAGSRLAPPLAIIDGILLISDCATPPASDAVERTLLGCYRIITSEGVDRVLAPIWGAAADVATFADEPGPSALYPQAPERVRWQRTGYAVDVDLTTGTATPASPLPAAITARHGKRSWQIQLGDDALEAIGSGADSWKISTRFAALLGVIPGVGHEVPTVRVAHLNGTSGRGFVGVLDIDATGSRRGQAAHPIPGIVVLAHAFLDGDTALAVRLDTSLRHDYLAAFDRRANLRWLWPLPELTRVDPVGLAISDAAVYAFFDGAYVARFAR